MIKRLLAAGALALSVATTAYAEPLKVGFVYVGPIEIMGGLIHTI